jgi:exodeoxyribonuclease-1
LPIIFAFYDLETTGISPAFDQPLQFAAILTDEAFKEIERINLRCCIAPHIIPSPWALAITGVRPAQLEDPTLPTLFEFTQTINALIDRWSPAIWTGFNSIRFDEEMLRQAFYQNLQPNIYVTQFNGKVPKRPCRTIKVQPLRPARRQGQPHRLLCRAARPLRHSRTVPRP